MSIDTLTVGAGAAIGPHCVGLPASGVGAGAMVGPALVMRGDSVPASTWWQGSPIAAWAAT